MEGQFNESTDFNTFYNNTNVTSNNHYIPNDIPSFNYAIYSKIRFYCIGILIPIGAITNILTVLVICCTRAMRQTTTGLYLVSLALADEITIIGGECL